MPVSLCPEVPSWGLSGRAENTTGIFAQCLHDGPETLVPRAIGTARSRAAWQQGLAFVFFFVALLAANWELKVRERVRFI